MLLMRFRFLQASKQRLPDKVTIKKTTTRVLEFANRLALPQRILDFCGSFPIYKAEEISLDSMNASFHKTQGKNTKQISTYKRVHPSA